MILLSISKIFYQVLNSTFLLFVFEVKKKKQEKKQQTKERWTLNIEQCYFFHTLLQKNIQWTEDSLIHPNSAQSFQGSEALCAVTLLCFKVVCGKKLFKAAQYNPVVCRELQASEPGMLVIVIQVIDSDFNTIEHDYTHSILFSFFFFTPPISLTHSFLDF